MTEPGAQLEGPPDRGAGAAPSTRVRSAAARGRAQVLAATFFWGTSATLARFVFRDRHVSPLAAVELRLVFASVLLGLWLATAPRAERIARRDWGYFLVLGLIGLAAVQGSYYYSISVLGVGLAILIQYLAPSLLVMWDMMRGVRVGPGTILAVIGALAGTALLLGDLDRTRIHATPIQWAVSFSAAFSFAFYIAWSKRGLARYEPRTVLFATFCIAAVFWAIITPPWRIVAAHFSAEVWIYFVLLGIFSTLVPFLLFNSGLRHLSATEAGILSTFEPVVAVISAAVFLGEGLRPLQCLGAFLVLLAAVLSSQAATADSSQRRPE